jgi:hypothetical protein
MCSIMCVFVLFAQSKPDPIVQWFEHEFTPELSAPVPSSRSASSPQACPVDPLPPITDPVAASFNDDQTLDTRNLTSGMARALERFRRLVLSIGGSIELKSAYRPPAYQVHLQQVWDKWMQLRNNQTPACQPLRVQVKDEFLRHHLIESQRPVDSSDHTRGLAFDAAVVLPKHPSTRRRVSLDGLARISGLWRPDILHDPVHFKFVGGTARGVSGSNLHTATRRIRRHRRETMASSRRHHRVLARASSTVG